MKKYDNFDENFLNEIDCAWKAYFLGFFAADGSVTKRKNSIMIAIHYQDVNILRNFNDLIFPTHNHVKIRSRKTPSGKETKHCYLQFSNAHIKNKLITYGIGPKKSLTLEFPEIMKNSIFLNDFIRGYFDGDGSLSRTKSHPHYRVQFAVTENFGKSLKNIIELQCGIHCALHQMRSIYNLVITGNRQVKTFCDWMYKESSIHLARKFNKYHNLIEHLQNLDSTKIKNTIQVYDRRIYTIV